LPGSNAGHSWRTRTGFLFAPREVFVWGVWDFGFGLKLDPGGRLARLPRISTCRLAPGHTAHIAAATWSFAPSLAALSCECDVLRECQDGRLREPRAPPSSTPSSDSPWGPSASPDAAAYSRSPRHGLRLADVLHRPYWALSPPAPTLSTRFRMGEIPLGGRERCGRSPFSISLSTSTPAALYDPHLGAIFE